MPFEPMVVLWDGEKLMQKPLSEALRLVEEGKAQRAEDYYTGRGLVPRSAMSAYQTKVMVAADPTVAPSSDLEVSPKKRGRPRKERPDDANDITADEAGADESADQG